MSDIPDDIFGAANFALMGHRIGVDLGEDRKNEIVNDVARAIFMERQACNGWKPIDTAPKNKEGDSYGVWLIGYHEFDKSVYQMRWECNGPVKGWMAKGQPHSFFSNRVSHWMPLLEPPKDD